MILYVIARIHFSSFAYNVIMHGNFESITVFIPFNHPDLFESLFIDEYQEIIGIDVSSPIFENL